MSAPYGDPYDERDAPPVEGEYADDDLLEHAPYVTVWCDECGTNRRHADFCDEHGANKLTACLTCRRVLRFHPFLE